MNLDHEDILMHTIGLQHRDSTPYRNHYVTGPDNSECMALVELGLMEVGRRPLFLDEGQWVFRVTEEGRGVAMGAHKRKFPPLSRGAKRYRRWLCGCADVTTFGEWLKMGCP